MKKRKEINDNLVKWIVNKVSTEYANDVSLVLIYGSYVNGTVNSKSDVDCYYIPKSEHGYHLAVDFIIEGIGYDIFSISWERVERIANLYENMSPLVGNVQIIYSNSTEDIECFETMQARLKSNLLNDKYVKEIAIKRCEEARRFCAMLNQIHSASEVRKFALQEASGYKSQIVNKVDASRLASLYEEISSTFNKILYVVKQEIIY